MNTGFSRLHRRSARERRPWHGSAFVVEALMLLVFLVASLAVLIQVMGGARERSDAADRLSNAVILASNNAELFATDPTTGDLSSVYTLVDGKLAAAAVDDNQLTQAHHYNVERTVRARAEQSGTLYEAHIEVTSDDTVVYQVDTARYVSDEGV